MIQLGKLILPTVLSVDTIHERVTLRIPNYGTQEYIEQSDGFLQLTFIGTCIEVDYCSENGITLSNLISEELTEIAVGDLKFETFEAIQSKAFKVLSEYMDDAQQELLGHFKEL
jgi:hypothetical protein